MQYEAEDGMTWEEWVASDYNTGGYTVNMGGIYTGNDDIYVHNTAAKFDVTSSKSEITNGYDYILRVRLVWS